MSSLAAVAVISTLLAGAELVFSGAPPKRVVMVAILFVSAFHWWQSHIILTLVVSGPVAFAVMSYSAEFKPTREELAEGGPRVRQQLVVEQELKLVRDLQIQQEPQRQEETGSHARHQMNLERKLNGYQNDFPNQLPRDYYTKVIRIADYKRLQDLFGSNVTQISKHSSTAVTKVTSASVFGTWASIRMAMAFGIMQEIIEFECKARYPSRPAPRVRSRDLLAGGFKETSRVSRLARFVTGD